MHVKIDEDLPKSVVDLLRAEGYQATSVREQGLQGMKDSALWQVVQQDGASSLRDKRCSLAGLAGLLAVATPRGLRVRRAAP